MKHATIALLFITYTVGVYALAHDDTPTPAPVVQGYTQQQVDAMLYQEAAWWSSTHMSIVDAVIEGDTDDIIAGQDLMLSRLDRLYRVLY
jgi:hypothetical protein